VASPFNSSVCPVLSSTYRPRSGRASHPIGVARSRQRTSESQSIESSQRPCARPPTCSQGHIRTENLLINVIGRKDLRSVTKISQGVTCRSGRPPDCWPLSVKRRKNGATRNDGNGQKLHHVARRPTARMSSNFGWRTARPWRSACRLERPACSSISRSECPMGCSCRTWGQRDHLRIVERVAAGS